VSGIVKKILRAAVAQPWDYMGEGAPNEWEFRVSPDERTFAVWHPGVGRWEIIDFATGRKVAEATQAEMNAHTADWSRYVEELDGP
jgi:hypothetical protein